jgi:hypothetical protein
VRLICLVFLKFILNSCGWFQKRPMLFLCVTATLSLGPRTSLYTLLKPNSSRGWWRSTDHVCAPIHVTVLALSWLYLVATKMHAVVAGQTSVKAPEKAAFEKYLPDDVHIISCHSLHGPTVNPVGQPLVRSPSFIYPRNPQIKFVRVRKGHYPTPWVGRCSATR